MSSRSCCSKYGTKKCFYGAGKEQRCEDNLDATDRPSSSSLLILVEDGRCQ